MTLRLVYGFDPLCGWCFGFAPALRTLRGSFPELSIQLRMGGLVTGAKVRPYAEMSDYIQNASSRLQSVTGVTLGSAFKSNILSDPKIIASSIPPCDVLLQVRAAFPDRVLDFAEALQAAHFRDGMDLNATETYTRIVDALGIDLKLEVPAPGMIRAALMDEFSGSRTLGLTSFPTLLAVSDDGPSALPVSYDPQVLKRTVERVLASHPSPGK